jgi:superfamily II DNA or RNA helicase
MGVYPILSDDSCRFLAADFDGKSWQEDANSFAETSKGFGFPPAIERSRSGQGAHAWFFFAASVSAVSARSLGCYLLTETMSRRHELSLKSYDRLFPNQDTLPKGGFGNLIALPLQRDARLQGNSVFVDEGLTPYPDQWKFLAGIVHLDVDTLERAVKDAANRGRIVGFKEYPVADDVEFHSRRVDAVCDPGYIELDANVPSIVQATLAERLVVQTAGLPSPLINELKRLAAFANPEFYKKQRMRLSTALTPRIISCAEEFADRIALPRGCTPGVKALLAHHGIALAVDDQRTKGTQLDVVFKGKLTVLQEEAAQSLFAEDLGVLVAPPGIGKTVVGCHLIASRKRNTLVIVHRQQLLAQWIVQLSYFLGLEQNAIGQIGGGKRNPNGKLDVAMLQSLVHRGKVDEVVKEYGHVMVDECHHCPAFSFERVLSEAKARYITGFTATPQRRDGQHPIIEMQLGPARFVVSARTHNQLESFHRRLVIRETEFALGGINGDAGIQGIYAALAADQARNDLIFDDVIAALENKRSPILLTERRDHLEHFVERLKRFARHLIVLHGRMKPKDRAEAMSHLAAIPDGEERLIVATGRYIGEGFDDARLDTLVLALPVSWKGTIVQYAGRLNREHEGKSEVLIYDYFDKNVPVLRKMFEKRLRGYRAIGYEEDTKSQRGILS